MKVLVAISALSMPMKLAEYICTDGQEKEFLAHYALAEDLVRFSSNKMICTILIISCVFSIRILLLPFVDIRTLLCTGLI